MKISTVTTPIDFPVSLCFLRIEGNGIGVINHSSGISLQILKSLGDARKSGGAAGMINQASGQSPRGCGKGVLHFMTSAGEREVEGLTGTEEVKLIAYLKSKGWTAEEIIALIEYIRG